MGKKQRTRKLVKQQQRENATAMRGLERLAKMTDEDARAYIEQQRIREARRLNTAAPIAGVRTEWKRKGRRA